MVSREKKSKSAGEREFRVFSAFIILIFTLASILSINQYRFGIADQTITIPFLKAFVNHNLYPNDYLLGQRAYYYTYFWHGLGLLVRHFNFDLATLSFFSYLIFLYLTFLGVYLIATVLFGKKEVAALALFFLLFNKGTLAGTATLENIFLTRMAVLPILLFSIYFFLRERYEISFFFSGIGFLIHPMTTVYVVVMIFVAALFNLRSLGIKRFLLGVTIMLVLASPILIWKFLHSSSSLPLLYVDPSWFNLLKLRSSHHLFPFSWSKDIFFQSGLLLFLFLISWKHKPTPKKYHRIVLSFTLAILTMCVLGIIFSELMPLAIVLNLQLLRSFQFLIYFTLIYFSNYFWTEIKLRKNLSDKLLISFASIGIFYGATAWKYAYVALLTLVVVLFLSGHLYRRKSLSPGLFVLGLVVVTLILASGAYLKKGVFSLSNAQEKNWLNVQQWAKKRTDFKDLFIVPYNSEGFRVESERSIYGDWKDGTLINFNPKFAYEWYRRMKKLGFEKGRSFQEGFKNLTEADFIDIANEAAQSSNEIFLVSFQERRPLDFPLVYQNEKYLVYKIAPPKKAL